MADIKITKKDNYMALKELAIAANRDELVEFIDAQVAQLDKRAIKAKEYKAKKAKAADPLKEKVAAALTFQYETADDITNIVAAGDESITRAKVVARLGALVREDRAVKTTLQTEDKRRIMAYAIKVNEE